MNEQHPWVRIACAGQHLGAGFLLTRVYVLTARHCLRNRPSHDVQLDLSLSDDRKVAGQVCDEIEQADLALIMVMNAHTHQLPPAPPIDWPRPRVDWTSSYRPPNEGAALNGLVTHAPVEYRNADGGSFTALQLAVHQLLRDYSGYSGSPISIAPRQVSRHSSGQWPVAGILMEQQLSRDEHASGTNVVFAASVRHAIELFPHFSNVALMEAATSSEPPGREVETAATESTDSGPTARQADRAAHEAEKAATEEILRCIKQWEGVLKPLAEAREHRSNARWSLWRLLRRRGTSD